MMLSIPNMDARKLIAELTRKVVRWERANFVLNILEPHYCERHGWKPGRRTKGGQYCYGFDADGRLLVERDGSSIALHIHKKNGIERLRCDGDEIQGRSHFKYEAGRLISVTKTFRGAPKIVDKYEYDRAGRVARVHVSRPLHVDELEYDDAGLVRVFWRHPSGSRSEHFRRAPREDSLKLLVPALKKKLLDEIPRTIARARLTKPAYCLALTCNLEEAPHLMPPRITVGLVKDRDRILAKGGEYALDEIWAPEQMPLHMHTKLDLKDRELAALCRRANVARRDDTPLLKMLREIARELQPRKLALVTVPEFFVYAVDVGGENGHSAARRAAPKNLSRRLTAKKML
jgi:hypothetical protein